MTKSLSLAQDGSIQKTPACLLAEGEAERVAVVDLGDLAKVILAMRTNEALCYGITKAKTVPIVAKAFLPKHTGAIARDAEHFAFPKGPGVMMFDYDPVDDPLPPAEVLGRLRQALPEVHDVSLMWRPSASSCVYDKNTGKEIQGIRGLRIWMLVSDASQIPHIAEALKVRLWALGYATYRVSKSGKMLDRPMFDMSVYQPERVDFSAGAICQPPLEQRLPAPAIVMGSEDMYDSAKLPVVTSADYAAAGNNMEQARKLISTEALATQAIWKAARAAELAAKRGIDRAAADEAVKLALDQSVLAADFVLISTEFGEVTVADVLAAVEKFDGTRFADPLEPDYNGDPRIAWMNLKCEEPYLYSHAHGGTRYELRSHSAQPATHGNKGIIDALNEEFALVTWGKDAVIARRSIEPSTGQQTISLLSLSAFYALMNNQPNPSSGKGSLGTYWMSHPKRRHFNGVEFHPTMTTLDKLNLFGGFAIKPTPGSTALFHQYLLEVICNNNRTAYQYVWKWLAHLVQKPHELPETALVLRGPQGAGKGRFANTVGKLVGRHYVTLTSMDQVTGRFTGHMKEALVVFADEAIWGGTKSQQGALKTMITETQCAVEQKGVDIINVRNFRRFIIASNNRWAVPVDADDRRFVFLDVSDVHAQDLRYYGALNDELERGGYEALMYELMAVGLDGFDPRVRPHTGFGFDAKLMSSGAIERWLYDVLTLGGARGDFRSAATGFVWKGELDKEELFKSYNSYCRSVGERYPSDRPQFHKDLQKIIRSLRVKRAKATPAHQISVNIPGPSPSSAKMPKRPRIYRAPNLPKARKEFEQYMHALGQIDWPKPEIES